MAKKRATLRRKDAKKNLIGFDFLCDVACAQCLRVEPRVQGTALRE